MSRALSEYGPTARNHRSLGQSNAAPYVWGVEKDRSLGSSLRYARPWKGCLIE
jgi:hypothetical protein